MSRAISALVLIVFCSSIFLTNVLWASEDNMHVLNVPSKVLWIARDNVDGKHNDKSLAPVALKKALEPLGFIYVDKAKSRELARQCDFDSMVAGNFCKAVKPYDADLVFVCDVEGQSKQAGVQGEKKGVKVKVKIQMFRVDLQKKFNQVKQPSYGIGETPVKAVFAALKKVDKPIATRLAILTNVETKAVQNGVINVKELEKKSRIDDLLQMLPRIKGVREGKLLERIDGGCRIGVEYREATWGAVIRNINKFQGGALEVSVSDFQEASANYLPHKAFSLLTAVGSFRNRTNDKGYDEFSEKIADAVEKRIKDVPYIHTLYYPERLTWQAATAKRLVKSDYNGDLLLVGQFRNVKGEYKITIDVHSVYAGKLFSITKATDSLSGLDMLFIGLDNDIEEKLLPALNKKRFKLKGQHRKNLEAYLKWKANK